MSVLPPANCEALWWHAFPRDCCWKEDIRATGFQRSSNRHSHAKGRDRHCRQSNYHWYLTVKIQFGTSGRRKNKRFLKWKLTNSCSQPSVFINLKEEWNQCNKTTGLISTVDIFCTNMGQMEEGDEDLSFSLTWTSDLHFLSSFRDLFFAKKRRTQQHRQMMQIVAKPKEQAHHKFESKKIIQRTLEFFLPAGLVSSCTVFFHFSFWGDF